MTSPYVDLFYHSVPLLAISLAVLINWFGHGSRRRCW
jgi:hypothetical protein